MKPNVLLGVSASISAYKAADLISGLNKRGCEVHVVMTNHATQFIPELTLQTLSKHPVLVDIMTENDASSIQHIQLAQQCDAFVIAPASANIIGKLANGIADDALSTVALAVPAATPKWIAPAMNTQMYQHPAVQRNLNQLQQDGYHIIEPKTSLLACGVEGKGALANVEDIIQSIMKSVEG